MQMLVCVCTYASVICVEDAQILCVHCINPFRSTGGGDQCIDTGVQHWGAK